MIDSLCLGIASRCLLVDSPLLLTLLLHPLIGSLPQCMQPLQEHTGIPSLLVASPQVLVGYLPHYLQPPPECTGTPIPLVG